VMQAASVRIAELEAELAEMKDRWIRGADGSLGWLVHQRFEHHLNAP